MIDGFGPIRNTVKEEAAEELKGGDRCSAREGSDALSFLPLEVGGVTLEDALCVQVHTAAKRSCDQEATLQSHCKLDVGSRSIAPFDPESCLSNPV